ncbi:MAG: SelT/SelW/SelH family protein [Candidatus Rokubacteria bacterium]|nr:SelT/SelW/SelH family protein [Candidatus Rokubacteria bacterium]
MQAAIKKAFELTADLKEGHGGVFDVTVDGQLVYSKDQTNRFPTDEEILEKIRARRKNA